MPDKLEIPPHVAAHIIQRVGESGQPPECGVGEIQVGFDPYLDVLVSEYLDPIVGSGRNATFKLVQAGFGGGKSLFLRCVRDLGWERGMASAIVCLSAKECPFDNALLIYRAVAAVVSLPPADRWTESEPGLDYTLRNRIETLRDQLGESGVRKWIRTELRRARVDSRAFRNAVVAFVTAVLDRDEEAEDLIGGWLLGEKVRASLVAEHNIRDSITTANGFRMLRSLVQILNALGCPGLVLGFDEVDKNLSLSRRRREAVAENLRELLDRCGTGALPGLVCLYAVPPEFLRHVVPEYPALQQRLEAPHPLASASPQSVLIDLEEVSLAPEALLIAIGGRLLKLFEHARGVTLDADLQLANLTRLAKEVSESSFEVAHRRAFVKSAVDLLFRQQADEHAITDEELRALVGQSAIDDTTGPGEEF